MNLQTCTNGNLKLSANKKQIAGLIQWRKKFHNQSEVLIEKEFVSKYLKGFKMIKAEDCGALTGATLITDGKDVWGDMQYQVQSFIQELIAGNVVIWYKG